MKKNYLLIIWAIFIISIVFKKLGWFGGGYLITLSSISLIIGFTNKLVRTKNYPIGLKLISIEIYIYLIFTLIGLLFRHQFWYLPFWYELYKYAWPVFSVIVIIHSIIVGKIHFKALTNEYKTILLKEYIIPLVIIYLLAIPTFFTTTQNFVKIFKPYTYEELMNRWNSENK